jgi:hypothetical protein
MGCLHLPYVQVGPNVQLWQEALMVSAALARGKPISARGNGAARGKGTRVGRLNGSKVRKGGRGSQDLLVVEVGKIGSGCWFMLVHKLLSRWSEK